jgi:hypothetical protein
VSTTIPAATAILEEDGAEAALIKLASGVKEGEDAIRSLLRKTADTTWTIRALQDEAAGERSSSVMSIAFLRLLKAGEVHVDHATSIVQRA